MRLLFLAWALLCTDQLLAADLPGTPATSNVRGVDYPRILPDRRVSFRFKAAEAKKMQLQPGGDDNGLASSSLEMQRETNGFWTVTTPPAVPGFHYYWFLLDGVPVNDPGSETFFGWGRQTSGVEVPEPGTDFYEAQEVSHGEVRAFWYHSKVTGKLRRAFVYTPPGYETKPELRYPVLYLQHGAGEDERGWTTQGRMNFILDNLLAAGKAKPMLVVMDCGYAARPGEPPPAARPPGAGARPGLKAFEDVVIGELIPAVDANFRTKPDAAHRAMAGLSMGGMQTLQIALTHFEMFSHIGSFSGPSPAETDLKSLYQGAFSDPAALNQRVKVFWLGAGTAEKRIHDSIARFHEALDRAGIHHVFVESAATAHEWQTWRRAFYDFAPRLFRD
jgi:enterochelin esterase family protein